MPRLAVEASAGHGTEAGGEEVVAQLAFRRGWLRQHGLQPSKLSIIEMNGDSMVPTFVDGDAVLVDRGSTEPQRGRVVVAWTEEGLTVKRLERLGKGWLLTSDSPGYPPVPLTASNRIVGRAVWRSALVKDL